MNEPLPKKRESHPLDLESYEHALALFKLAKRQAALRKELESVTTKINVMLEHLATK